jgi:amino acid transporter
MSFLNKLFGRPLPTSADKKQALSVYTGVPALGLDALASIGYGPEAALTILLPLGTLGLHYFPIVTLMVITQLILLYLSYQQTAGAYPNGGGAYIVASDNLGKFAGLCAGAALLIDYLLNVAVGISAGVGAIVSAIPSLHSHTLSICLMILAFLTIINLRGMRESGLLFITPTLAFVVCLGAALVMGAFNLWVSGGQPHAVIAPPAIPARTASVSTWILLCAFANGLTAMTGIEAVSNAIPLFRKPVVRNARWTLTIIVGMLALYLLAIGYLCPAYHIGAMDEYKPGYQTILSQLVGAVAGQGIFYYISIATIFFILTFSAQTSFAGFPRVCRLLADDSYLPHFFADKGSRLVFSHGIIILALLAGGLLILFDGITARLIPLFAVGAFSAFLFSNQA